MPAPRFSFQAEVWEHDGAAAWFFVSVPTSVADDIAELSLGRERGFGSVRVEATIGATRWCTSLFPDGGRGTYVLPLKKAVRRAEDLAPGSTAAVVLTIVG